jgi:hypothetical protein
VYTPISVGIIKTVVSQGKLLLAETSINPCHGAAGRIKMQKLEIKVSVSRLT